MPSHTCLRAAPSSKARRGIRGKFLHFHLPPFSLILEITECGPAFLLSPAHLDPSLLRILTQVVPAACLFPGSLSSPPTYQFHLSWKCLRTVCRYPILHILPSGNSSVSSPRPESTAHTTQAGFEAWRLCPCWTLSWHLPASSHPAWSGLCDSEASSMLFLLLKRPSLHIPATTSPDHLLG